MSSFPEDHARWQEAQRVAGALRSRAAVAEAERQRHALIASRAVRRARQATNARPVR